MRNNNERSMEWWESLTPEQQTEMEKSHGMYGHDIGTDIFDVLTMWRSEGSPEPIKSNNERDEYLKSDETQI